MVIGLPVVQFGLLSHSWLLNRTSTSPSSDFVITCYHRPNWTLLMYTVHFLLEDNKYETSPSWKSVLCNYFRWSYMLLLPRKATKYFLVRLTPPKLVPFRQKIIVSVSVQDKTPCDQDRFLIEDKLDRNPR